MPDVCGGRSRALLTVGAGPCVGTVLENTDQPPLVVGLSRGTDTAQPLVDGVCPMQLQVDRLAVSSIDQVPPSMDLYLTIGEQLVRVRLDFVIGCNLVPGLVCDP
jgi:hypothetical protein